MFWLFLNVFLFWTQFKAIKYQLTSFKVWDIPFVDIIYRPERWAKNSWLFTNNPFYKEMEKNIKPLSDYEKYQQKITEKRNNYLKNNYPWKYVYQKTINTIWNKKLYRDLQYYLPKRKIVLHHTALPYKELKNKKTIEENLQYIQELHCFYRWWWDIWYHFLIWPNWWIYEWRFWWEWIVWAHAQFNNLDSIWITMLWNFQTEKLNNEQLKSLILLTTELSRKFNIDLTTWTVFFNKIEIKPYLEEKFLYPIWYHKLISNTACPWKFLIKHFDYIKNITKILTQNFNHSENLKYFLDNVLTWDIDYSISFEKLKNNILKQEKILFSWGISKKYNLTWFKKHLYKEFLKKYDNYKKNPTDKNWKIVIIYAKRIFFMK